MIVKYEGDNYCNASGKIDIGAMKTKNDRFLFTKTAKQYEQVLEIFILWGSEGNTTLNLKKKTVSKCSIFTHPVCPHPHQELQTNNYWEPNAYLASKLTKFRQKQLEL